MFLLFHVTFNAVPLCAIKVEYNSADLVIVVARDALPAYIAYGAKAFIILALFFVTVIIFISAHHRTPLYTDF